MQPKAKATDIAFVKIHPAIGIARLGNSPSGFFIGPEVPGVFPDPKGGFKDTQGRIKRQAARFRIFGYDKKGKLIREIDGKEAEISWTVHLANGKSAWKRFSGLSGNTALRNKGIKERPLLIIDPGPRSLSGSNRKARFDTGKFMGVGVPLGEARTDEQGRLLVLGGSGAASSPENKPLTTYANNDGWHDDVSDGPVSARVTFKSGGKSFEAAGAWVICAPPRFAPHLDNVVTLYDVCLQIAVDRFGFKLPAKPSFRSDVKPILERGMNTRWVTAMIPKAHAHGTLTRPASHASPAASRKAIFSRLRDPALAFAEESESDMPMLWSDHYKQGASQPLTRIQYGIMKKWAEGKFIDDRAAPEGPPPGITPEGLDRAAIENCVGAAFYPGIEAGWFLRDKAAFSEPFRLEAGKLEAGDLTKQMAVPWQADFYECTQEGEYAWWPAARPDDVFPEAGGSQVPWIRKHIKSAKDMVRKWHRLGFIVKKGERYVETERKP